MTYANIDNLDQLSKQDLFNIIAWYIVERNGSVEVPFSPLLKPEFRSTISGWLNMVNFDHVIDHEAEFIQMLALTFDSRIRNGKHSEISANLREWKLRMLEIAKHYQLDGSIVKHSL